MMRSWLAFPVLWLETKTSLSQTVKNERETDVYRSAMRQMVPDKCISHQRPMLRMTLKKDIKVKQISLESVTLDRQLDNIVRQGYTSLQIYVTPLGGKRFEVLNYQ